MGDAARTYGTIEGRCLIRVSSEIQNITGRFAVFPQGAFPL